MKFGYTNLYRRMEEDRMTLEPFVCPECGANDGLTQVEPDTYYCPYHKGLFKYVDPAMISVGTTVLDAESEADSSTASQMEIHIYLDTDDGRVASSIFIAIDELAKTLGVADIALTEFSRGSFIRRSKASFQAGLSDTAIQQRLQTLERFIELWQVDPRQAEVDQRTSEAFARMISCLENVPRACIRFGSLLIVKYPDGGSGHVLLCRQLSQTEIWAFEKYPELQSHPETVLNSLALAVSRNNESESSGDSDLI